MIRTAKSSSAQFLSSRKDKVRFSLRATRLLATDGNSFDMGKFLI